MEHEQLLTALIIVSELALALLAILSFIIVVYVKRNQRKKGEVSHFQKQVKDSSKQRQEKLLKILLDKHGSEQNNAQQFLQKVVNNETTLYQNIMSAYLGKKKDPLGIIGKQVESLVMTCCDDLPPKDTSDELAMIDELQERSKHLEEENKSLKEKLKMFTEFEDKSEDTELYWEQANEPASPNSKK